MAAPMSFEEASRLMNENPNSQLVMVPSKQHIKLSPKYIGSVKAGVSEALNSNLLFFSKELDGVPVAFRNIKALQRDGKIIADQPCLHFDIEADFILFKPTEGCILKGVINKLGKKHVGCLVHGCFNAWLPRDDITVAMETDLLGKEVEFKVKETFSSNRVVSLRGIFHRLVLETKSGKKAKKAKLKALAAEMEKHKPQAVEVPMEVDSLDDSMHMEPLMSSTQIETPAPPSHRKHKKQKKSKLAELSNMSEKSLEVSEIAVNNESLTGDDTGTMIENEDSSTQKKKKKKKKKKKSKGGDEESVKMVEVVMDKQEGQERSQTQTDNRAKSKNLKRKINEDKTENFDSTGDFVTPRKKVKKEKTETPIMDSSANDSNNNLKKHKKSKKKKKDVA